MRKIFPIVMLCVCIGACMNFWASKPDHRTSEKITVGVLNFQLNSSREELEPFCAGLTDMFITELQKVPQLQLVERTRLDDIMNELGVTGQDNIGPGKTGRIMGAQAVFYGSLMAVGNMMRLDVRLVRVETNETLASGIYTSDIDDRKLFNMVGKVSEKIATKVKANHKKLVADNLYSKGRNAEEKNDRDGAVSHYQKALDYYPDHEYSQKALKRLQQ